MSTWPASCSSCCRSSSHLNAPLAIGQALQAAGHEVAWCGPRSDLRPLIGPDATLYPTGKRYFRNGGDTGMASVREPWEGHVLPVNRFIRDAADRARRQAPAGRRRRRPVRAGRRAGRAPARVKWATFCVGTLELTPPTREMPEFDEWVRSQLARVWALTDLPVDEDSTCASRRTW